MAHRTEQEMGASGDAEGGLALRAS
eukprot:COSAG01_NODE_75044_length_198_cov_801.060606_1_plen_24_part_10